MFHRVLNLSLKHFTCMLEACNFTKNQLLFLYFPLDFVQIASYWLLPCKIPTTIFQNIFFDGCFYFFFFFNDNCIWQTSFSGRGVCLPIVNLVRITHEKYIRLEKIYSSHPEKIFEQTPTLKDVFSNIDNQSPYQGAMLKNLEREKECVERNMSCLIQDIIKFFE